MKKYIWFLFILSICWYLNSLQASTYFGKFGTSTEVDDTCQLCFPTFDDSGHTEDALGDSIYLLRFTRGSLIDSTYGATKTRPAYYCFTKKAYDGTNLGEYHVVAYWRPKAGRWYNDAGFYLVEPETTEVSRSGYNIASGGFPVGGFASGAITADAIATDAIGSAEIATGAIGTAEFAAETDIVSAGAITTSGGAVSTVTTTGTATAVTTVNGLANNVITTLSIADEAITSAKLATNVIDSSKIAPASIGSSEASNLDATISSRATQNAAESLKTAVGYDADTSLHSIIRYLYTATGYDADSSLSAFVRYIHNKTTNLPSTPASGIGLDSLRTTLGYDADSSISTIIRYLLTATGYDADSSLSAFVRYIHNKTNNLPDDPADQSLIMAEVGNIDGWNPDDWFKTLSGTVDGNSNGSTVIDAGLGKENDWFNGLNLIITSGYNDDLIRYITGYDSATGTFTVYPTFPESVLIGVTYLIRKPDLVSYVNDLRNNDTTYSSNAGTGLDSATTSRIIGRKVWGITSNGSDSTAISDRKVGYVADFRNNDTTWASNSQIDAPISAVRETTELALNFLRDSTFDASSDTLLYVRKTISTDTAKYVVDLRNNDTVTAPTILSEVANIDGWNPITDGDSLIISWSELPNLWAVVMANSFTSGTFGRAIHDLYGLQKAVQYPNYVVNPGFEIDSVLSGVAPTGWSLGWSTSRFQTAGIPSNYNTGNYVGFFPDYAGIDSIYLETMEEFYLPKGIYLIGVYADNGGTPTYDSLLLIDRANNRDFGVDLPPCAFWTALTYVFRNTTADWYKLRYQYKFSAISSWGLFNDFFIIPYSADSISHVYIADSLQQTISAQVDTVKWVKGGIIDTTKSLNWVGVYNDTASNTFSNTRIEKVDTVDQILESFSATADTISIGRYTSKLVMDSLRNAGAIAFVGTERCSLLVLDDEDDPVENVSVVLKNTAGTTKQATATSDANGYAIFELDTLTYYRVIADLAGYTQDNSYDSFTVASGGSFDTVLMTAFDPGTPTDPNKCRLFQCPVKDFAGNILVNVKVTVTLNSDENKLYDSTGNLIISKSSKKNIAYTNSEGFWYMDVFQNSKIYKKTTAGTFVNANTSYTCEIELPEETVKYKNIDVGSETSWRVK